MKEEDIAYFTVYHRYTGKGCKLLEKGIYFRDEPIFKDTHINYPIDIKIKKFFEWKSKKKTEIKKMIKNLKQRRHYFDNNQR